MLGLYDSGLGGLTVLAALRQTGVDADIVYFADQAHVPYGDRSDADLYALLRENFALLATYGITAAVMACNTSCAVASRTGGFPAARFAVLDLIENAAAALRDTPPRRIAVVATAATVRSGAYRRAIARSAPHIAVTELAAPELVPLVESGAADSPRAFEAVADVCRALPAGTQAVLYGCTHYPLLDAAFAAALGPGVERIDPALAQARAAHAFVRASHGAAGSGATHFVTNADPIAFEANVRRWTRDASATFEHVPVVAAR